jgi:cobalt-zinc-cadmium efflux system protein
VERQRTVAHHDLHTPTDSRRIAIVLGLLAAFMAFEAGAGLAARSLALLSDAAHMLGDVAALAVTLVATRLASLPARGPLTFGYRRAEVLSAQFNGATLLVLGVLILVEGVRRLVSPPQVVGGAMLVVALVGVAVNVGAAALLSGAGRESMNVEGAFQHVATDLAAFVATALAGATILLTGFHRADGIAALVIAAIMLRSAVRLLAASGRVFLEAAPKGMDVTAIARAMVAHHGVVEVRDLHVWEVTSGFPALSAHVLVGRGDDCHDVRRRLEQRLAERFEITHTTLQVDHAGAERPAREAPEQRERVVRDPAGADRR